MVFFLFRKVINYIRRYETLSYLDDEIELFWNPNNYLLDEEN